NQTIEQIKTLLNGKTDALVALLEDEMRRLAGEKKFEEAAELRDRVAALRKYAERQKVVTDRDVDRDLFALEVDREDDVAVGVLFKVREGKIVGRQHKYLRGLDGTDDPALMQRFLEDYYTEATFFPDEVLLAAPAEDAGPLEALLREGRGRKVHVKVPERGEKADLMGMVQANARLLLGEWKLQRQKQEAERVPRSVLALERDLHLKKPPRRIECFDISHLAGTGTVASCVVFEDGRPKKSDYRLFKIRSLERGEVNDFQSMREVVERRYARLLEENGPWPDLVIIDGGKGQLSSAVEALQRVDVYGRFPVVGLAKRLEEVFTPGRSESVMIRRASSSLRLLKGVRDEAHRFAVTDQRKQRRLKDLHSELMDVPGVGAKSVQKLLTTFGSVKGVRAASEADLAAVVGPAMAQKVRAHFEAAPPSGPG